MEHLGGDANRQHKKKQKIKILELEKEVKAKGTPTKMVAEVILPQNTKENKKTQKGIKTKGDSGR